MFWGCASECLVRPGSNVEAQPRKAEKNNKLCVHAIHIAASVARLDNVVNKMFMLRSAEAMVAREPLL